MDQFIEQQRDKQSRKAFRVLLISAPWALFHRPSIQLATLRSYLQERGGYPVENRHLYLDIAKKISVELYSRIAASSWAGEALFAPLLFPEKEDDSARLFHQELKKDGSGKIPDYAALVDEVRLCCESWLSDLNVDRFDLIGFSICFSQLVPSLYLAAELKKKTSVPIVFGGTSCSAEVGGFLLEYFSQIDYLVDGEGEGALLELCNTLSEGRVHYPPRLWSMQQSEKGSHTFAIKHLDQLPKPDFTPYVHAVRHLFPAVPFMPILPIEFSRGCSWNRCTFCNLNLQWKGYRFKSAERMIKEVKELSVENESLNFNFTDNVLPPREADTFFKATAASGHDYHFFAEIRAKTSVDKLAHYRRGGLRSVQVGIESLSGSLLSRMGKGTTVMDNIAIMKQCSALNIHLMGNIITEFPGTRPEEIEETLHNLDFVLPFAPLDATSFFLGLGSPIYNNPHNYNITAITPHPKSRMLFPAHHQKSVLVAGYRGDKSIQEKQWQAVRTKISTWHTFHKKRSDGSKHPLYYRDGSNFLVIYQELPDNSTLLHRLRGISKKMYLFCEVQRTIQEVCTTLPSLSRSAIEGFIDQLCRKRLMFRDMDRVLSLAIRE